MSDVCDTTGFEVKASHGAWFTLRVFGKEGDTCDKDCEHIVSQAIGMFERSEQFSTLPFPCHVVINCLPTETICSGDQEGIGLYLQGVQVVSVGVRYPGKSVLPKSEWVREVQLSILHELAHWFQDLTGQLGIGEYEEQAESMAVAMLEAAQ